MSAGQWMWGPDGRRWHFDSGSLALDFGYTGDYGYDQPAWERLHEPTDLDDWMVARFGSLDAPVGAEQFARALHIRSAVTTLAHAAADGATFDAHSIDVLNAAAAETPIRPYLPGGGSSLAPVPSVLAALSTIAGNGIEAFISSGQRVRRCAGENCALIFFDHSRPNARRWCSMARCGNRAKVRAHRTNNER